MLLPLFLSLLSVSFVYEGMRLFAQVLVVASPIRTFVATLRCLCALGMARVIVIEVAVATGGVVVIVVMVVVARCVRCVSRLGCRGLCCVC